MTREQLSIAGTDPARDPEIDEALFPWLNAKQEKVAAGKREKNHHASLMVRLEAKGIAKYPYDDPDTGKRRFIWAEKKTTVKTSKAPAERKGRGRRGRKAFPAEASSDDRDVKPANGDQPAVSDDPFEGTRAKMREGKRERKRERSVLEEAKDAQAGADEESGGAFSIDEVVYWTSQASGTELKKRGPIVAVVPGGHLPGDVDKKYDIAKLGPTRDHESYIVVVDGELYRPVVSKLKRSRPRATAGKGKK